MAPSARCRISSYRRATSGTAATADLLLDSDVLIDSLRGERLLRIERPASYSVVTRCEIFAGSGVNEDLARLLLDALREIAVDRAIAERAGRLRRGSRMRTPDALIAATALEHGLALVTRNRRDFERVNGLRVLDPHDLAT
ncbi:MAG: type II toxin-antitoxin system VapC family toxin [Candidatus Limnocylindria bacterium]|nr:type II toxin-antitoxin system VapC family toxin [Candidatus Limnocylindria bacterium]